MATKRLRADSFINLPSGQPFYILTVQLIDSNGNLVNNANIVQNQTFQLNNLNVPTSLYVQLAEGNYTIDDVRFRVRYNGIVLWTSSPTNVVVSCQQLPQCDRAPVHELTLPLQVISANSLSAPFDGWNVFVVDWKIVTNIADTIPLRTGTYTPIEPKVLATFPEALPSGNYFMGIKGNSCASAWSYRPFTITGQSQGSLEAYIIYSNDN